MILDTSAVIAILLQEPGYEELFEKVLRARRMGIGAPTVAETGLVLSSKLATDATGMLERFLQRFEIACVPFGEAHWKEAVEAFMRYGRRRHAASLNFGDCLSYATARLASEPLLCTGSDFAKTDLELAS
jgi:ribonuclease VapC